MSRRESQKTFHRVSACRMRVQTSSVILGNSHEKVSVQADTNTSTFLSPYTLNSDLLSVKNNKPNNSATFPYVFLFFFEKQTKNTFRPNQKSAGNHFMYFCVFYKNTPLSLLCSTAKNNLKCHAIHIQCSHFVFLPCMHMNVNTLVELDQKNVLSRSWDSFLPPSAGNKSKKNG